MCFFLSHNCASSAAMPAQASQVLQTYSKAQIEPQGSVFTQEDSTSNKVDHDSPVVKVLPSKSIKTCLSICLESSLVPQSVLSPFS